MGSPRPHTIAYGVALWDLWGSMFLRCGTCMILRGLCNCGVGLMGHKPFSWGRSMGSMGVQVCAVWHLWDSQGSFYVIYGKSMGTHGAAVSDPWGTYGDTPLRSQTYGAIMGTISSQLRELRPYRNEDL